MGRCAWRVQIRRPNILVSRKTVFVHAQTQFLWTLIWSFTCDDGTSPQRLPRTYDYVVSYI